MTAVPVDPEVNESLLEEIGPGRRLHEARRAANLSLIDVAAQLHLDTSTIESLERDDYARLPAPAFVRGYLRAYARLLSMAPEPVVAAYDSRGFEPPPLVADISSGSQSQAESSDLPWRLMTYLVAAAVVTLVVVWWRNNMNDPFSVLDNMVGIEKPAVIDSRSADTSVLYQTPAPLADVSRPAMEPATPQAPEETSRTSDAAAPLMELAEVAADTAAPAQPVAEMPAPTVVIPAETAAPIEAPATAVASLDPAPAPAVQPAPEPAATEPVAEPAGSTAGPVPDMPVAGRLELAFTHDSWVEVYDAAGERVFFGMARAGRELDLTGNLPLKVLLGYARDIRVEYNGGLLDYAPFVNRGIARFTIGADGVHGEPDAAVGTPTTQQ